MDALSFFFLWLEVALEWEVEKTRVMQQSLREAEAALREKELERLILKENKEQKLAEVEDREKLLAHFVDFIDALDSKDPEASAQNFDEKAMMDSAFSMLNNVGDSNDLATLTTTTTLLAGVARRDRRGRRQ